MCSKGFKFIMAVFMKLPGRPFHHSCPTYLEYSLHALNWLRGKYNNCEDLT